MPNQEGYGYTLCVYKHPALPPERSEYGDLPKAEKAFQTAPHAAILWQTRPPGDGLGWIKVKEKAAPPPAPPGEKPAPKPVAKPSPPAH